MLDKPYCGMGKQKKDQKLGTMIDCCESNQIRLCGTKKIDPVLLEAYKKGLVKPESRARLMGNFAELDQQIKRIKQSIENEEDAIKRDALTTKMKKMIVEIKKISKKLKSIKN